MEEFSYPKAYLYRRIMMAKRFIDEHFQKSIDLEGISQEAHFSKYHFIRLFKRSYGKTPHQYLNSVRLEKARELLAQSKQSITAVCVEVGFDSLGSFSYLFNREVGMSPSAYRKMLRDKQDVLREKPLTYIPGCFAGAKGWLNEDRNFQ